MMFSPEELRWLHYSTAVAVQVLTRDGHPSAPIPAAMLDRIKAEIAAARERNESASGTEQLERGEIVSTAEAARILGCSQRRIQQRIAAGDLTAERVGRTYYLRRMDIEQWH